MKSLLFLLLAFCVLGYITQIPIDVFKEDTNNYRPQGDAFLAQAKRNEKFKEDMDKLIKEATESVQKMQKAREDKAIKAQQVKMNGGSLV
ncbi:hypothetical protein EIN_153270 [Entamoeba invadens IP1]|uniref:Uncharacterized protein n=1 Tax=Entamoeba invadens IP1 TaxID=370355 RepID=A0A0A1U8S2_ENTIV|nr:hypothetical protein EIN_153270 [Entamoeba invadens IP1]ELP91320.1 hypothetical protein EIN_153270 [Entamoeba invadens IP1]|eukprot:XP_004258091.1 hypothetical protein EIN_153270 [Entamoeba invadens IP1]